MTCEGSEETKMCAASLREIDFTWGRRKAQEAASFPAERAGDPMAKAWHIHKFLEAVAGIKTSFKQQVGG